MAKRNLDVDGYMDEEGFVPPDRDQVIQTVADLICGIDHIGGIVTVAPKRRQVDGDRYVTVGWSVLVDSFSPPVTAPKAPEVVQEAEIEPVPEPVGA